jgi:tetratricopeptide (TPR) repeat protein
LHPKTQKNEEANRLKQSFCQVLAAEAENITSPLNPAQVQSVEFTIPHLIEVATTLKSWLSDTDLIYPFVGLARFYEGLADYGQAEKWYKNLLEIAPDRLSCEHPSVADILNNLAAIYYDQGRYQEAESLFTQALKLRQKVMGENHPAVADSLNNLGNLYRVCGKFEQAEIHLKRSLKIIQENHLKIDTVEIANCIGNLGLVFYEQGKYNQAVQFMNTAHINREKILGSEHPHVANSLNDIGMLFGTLGQYKKAGSCHLHALSIRKKYLGEDHPDVAQSLNNLGTLYDSQKRYTEAESCYLHSLSIREGYLGENHPLVASTLHNLAGLYYDWRKCGEAKKLFERALVIREMSLGTEHPEYQKTRAGLKLLENNTELLQSLFGRIFLFQAFWGSFPLPRDFRGRILIICLGILILPFYTAWYLVDRFRRRFLGK